MAQDSETEQSQKTEQPTAKRLEDARKKGQIPQSKDVLFWANLCALTLLVSLVMPQIGKSFLQTLTPFLESPHQLMLGNQHISSFLLKNLLLKVGLPLVMFMAILIFVGLLQNRFVVSLESLKPKLSKISLSEGLKRIFSGKAILDFVKGFLKLCIVSFVVYLFFKNYWVEFIPSSALPVNHLSSEMVKWLTRFLIIIVIVYGFLAVFDYIYQWWQWHRGLKMSREELKEEYKETEGDPLIKQRLRHLRSENMRKRMMQEVPLATVVITNPTHFAVALKYNEGSTNAPVVVAKGMDFVALKIREVAEKHKVPIVENPPLARALYDTVELEQEIPSHHYKAVADIIRLIMKLKKQYF